jgi:hypothetical protein
VDPADPLARFVINADNRTAPEDEPSMTESNTPRMLDWYQASSDTYKHEKLDDFLLRKSLFYRLQYTPSPHVCQW